MPADLGISKMRKAAQGGGDASGVRFGDVLQDAVASVSDLQKASDVEIQKIMAGESDDLHTAVIAMQKADLSFQMLMQVRNKVVTAYQEVMRMQV
jgi:flagellar hook-basal body complex protein FliE